MKVIRIIGAIATYLCMILIAAMMLLMVSDVIARTVFTRPIPGATEWVQVMLVCCMTSLGASIMVGSMVEINMFTKRLKPVPQVALDVVVLFLSLVIIVLIAIQQFRAGQRSMQNNVVWSSVKVPQWPFLYLFGVSYAVAALVVIMTIIRKIVALAQGRAEEEVRLGSTDFEFAFGKYKMSMIPVEAVMGENAGAQHEVETAKEPEEAAEGESAKEEAAPSEETAAKDAEKEKEEVNDQ